MVRILLTSFILLVFSLNHVNAEKQKLLSPKEVVEKEMEYLSSDNTLAYTKLWVRAMQNELLFLHSPRSKGKETIYNVDKAELIEMKELPHAIASSYIPKLSRYISRFGHDGVKVLYIAANYSVREENKYQLNGPNYFLQVLVKEYGNWRIAESKIAPTDLISAAGHGFGTKEEGEYAGKRKNIE
ncbi:MAG: hypothetical protein ACE3JP_16455 [Ectobacillus sp.]